MMAFCTNGSFRRTTSKSYTEGVLTFVFKDDGYIPWNSESDIQFIFYTVCQFNSNCPLASQTKSLFHVFCGKCILIPEGRRGSQELPHLHEEAEEEQCQEFTSPIF